MFKRYERLVTEHPVLVLISSLIISVYFAYEIPGLKFSSSTDEFFIKGDPDKAYFEKAKELFGNDQVVVLALVTGPGESVFTEKRLEIIDSLTRDVARVDGVVSTVSLTNVPSIRAPRDPVTGKYQKSIEVKRLIPRIPRSDSEWSELKSEIKRNPLYLGNLVSGDERAAAVLIFIEDFTGQRWRYKEVMTAIKSVVAKEKLEVPRGDGLHLAGVPETRVEIEKRMVKDLKKLLPMTFLLIVTTLVISYRQVRGVLLPLVAIVMTTLWAVGFMEAANIPITLVSIILPPLMLALSSSYSIHMMSDYNAEVEEELSVPEIVRASLKNIALPVVVCGFTTMVGFASLILNRIPAIQDLGFAATVGIIFSVIVALFVIPSSLMLMKKPRKAAKMGEGPGSKTIEIILDRLAQFNVRHKTGVFAGVTVLVLLSLYGIYSVKIDTDFLSFFAKDDPVMVSVYAQADHLAGAAPFNIVLEADRAEVFKHPAMLKRIEELQKWAETEVEGIDATLSMADYVKLLSQAFHQNDPAYYAIPDTPLEVSQILFLYSTSGSPQDFAPYITTDYSAANVLIRSRLVGSTETNKAISRIEQKAKEIFAQPKRTIRSTPVKSQSPAPVRAAEGEELVAWDDADEDVVNWDGDSKAPEEDEVAWGDEDSGPEEAVDWGDGKDEKKDEDAAGPDSTPAAGGTASVGAGEDGDLLGLPAPSEDEFPWPHVTVHVTGTIHLMNRSADAVSRGQISGLGTALIAIFVIMSLLFLSPKIGLMAMLPNLFPIFMLFGIMGYSGITLNFSTSLIAAIALGIGVDDTIQYVNRYNMELQKTRDQTEAMINSLKQMGKPMIFTSVALFFGFIILLASDFVPIRQFGILTAVMMLIALSSNLVILPTLMISVPIITLWDLLDLEIGDNPAHYIKIFHGLSNHQAKVAVLMGHTDQYEDGDLIIREGEMGNEMFIVLKGYVKIVKGEGENEVTLFTIQPGDAFGEMALLRHTTRSASARAEGRVKLFVLDEQTLHRLQRRYPRISTQVFYNITQVLSDRLQSTTAQVYECSVDEEDA